MDVRVGALVLDTWEILILLKIEFFQIIRKIKTIRVQYNSGFSNNCYLSVIVLLYTNLYVKINHRRRGLFVFIIVLGRFAKDWLNIIFGFM
jgi:hypothetical protein